MQVPPADGDGSVSRGSPYGNYRPDPLRKSTVFHMVHTADRGIVQKSQTPLDNLTAKPRRVAPRQLETGGRAADVDLMPARSSTH